MENNFLIMGDIGMWQKKKTKDLVKNESAYKITTEMCALCSKK